MSWLREWLRDAWWKREWTRGSWDVMLGCSLSSFSLGFRIFWEWDTIGFSVDLGLAYFCLSYWR